MTFTQREDSEIHLSKNYAQFRAVFSPSLKLPMEYIGINLSVPKQGQWTHFLVPWAKQWAILHYAIQFSIFTSVWKSSVQSAFKRLSLLSLHKTFWPWNWHKKAKILKQTTTKKACYKTMASIQKTHIMTPTCQRLRKRLRAKSWGTYICTKGPKHCGHAIKQVCGTTEGGSISTGPAPVSTGPQHWWKAGQWYWPAVRLFEVVRGGKRSAHGGGWRDQAWEGAEMMAASAAKSRIPSRGPTQASSVPIRHGSKAKETQCCRQQSSWFPQDTVVAILTWLERWAVGISELGC